MKKMAHNTQIEIKKDYCRTVRIAIPVVIYSFNIAQF